MPLDHTRFTRTPPADPQPANKSVVDVVSARASTGTHRASSGITSRRTSRVLEMHEKEGMGQLTSDLTVHSLLEEVLEELRAIRIQLNNPTGPTSDLGRRMK